MLSALRLHNFKSFEDVEFSMAPLTLMMGENGVGKSSAIQSMLLLKQSFDTGGIAVDGLELNGTLCSVGLGRDLLREGSDDETIGISLRDREHGELNFLFGYQPDADRLRPERSIPKWTDLWSKGFVYLTAERVGPRLTNPRSIASATDRELGTRGEGALAVLERYRAEILPQEDPRRRGKTGSLEELFQTYLADISSNVRIELTPYGDVDSIGATYSYSLPGGIPGESFRPTNVGFGLSYTLPIIVACLVAQPGSMLIIENPEAHLHTRGQRAIAALLAATASAGVQVVVETHSREIFYSLRKLTIDGVLTKDLGCVNYVEATSSAKIQRISVCTSLTSLDADITDAFDGFFESFGSPVDLIMPLKS